MNTKDRQANQKDQNGANQRQGGVEDTPGNARQREMGQADEPLGDLGHGKRTWEPPAGEQGMSNRPDDAGPEEAFDDDEDTGDEIDGEDSEEAEEEVTDQLKAGQGQPRSRRQNPVAADVSQNVTTNPRDVGAGGGSAPLGEHGQDSRTWSADENDRQGGDRSNRAAQSGATGERKPLGAKNKPEPKDQDEKGMGHPRNR
jgi:hypothetical protein